jgi:hypothetical protein
MNYKEIPNFNKILKLVFYNKILYSRNKAHLYELETF